MASTNDELPRNTSAIPLAPFCCPTCGVQQGPVVISPPTSATTSQEVNCRRCGSDLKLVISLRETNEQLRRQCLAFLSQRRLLHATRIAKQCCEISSSEANSQLLATCYLLSGDFGKAGMEASRMRKLPE